MRPFIKWPGGKGRELERLRPLVPARFDRYVEPFVGGGALFFEREPRGALLNDAHPELVALYRFIGAGDTAFERALDAYVELWDDVLVALDAALGDAVVALAEGSTESAPPPAEVVALVSRLAAPLAAARVPPPFDATRLTTQLARSLSNKLGRLRGLERTQSLRFDTAFLRVTVETAVRAAFYTHCRDDLHGRLDPAHAAANFYFVRELCYGAMFRFSRDGRFNIPYGGIGYNAKRFAAKRATALAPARRALLAAATLENLDFRAFFERHGRGLGRDAFVFVDPPYDSDFSEYGARPFGPAEHTALADALHALDCRWLLVIKETQLVRDTYVRAGAVVARYDKQYGYNVRGRNVRETAHLAVANYPLPDAAREAAAPLA